MTWPNKALTEVAEILLDEWELTVDEISQLAQNLSEEAAAIVETRNEEAYERHQQSLMESGGRDDSSYRKNMIDAGRSHLLK